MMMANLQGALTALVTPFGNDDRVDVKALAKIVDRQLQNGIDGLVPCGTTGETPTLSESEQELVVRTVIETVRGRVPVIAGTGSNSTKGAIESTKRAKSWGIDAALVVTPYYNKPTQEGLFQHYKAVWEEVGLPIVAYNVPGRTAADLMPETIGRLVEIGAIAGVKDATASMQRAVETLAAAGDRPFALLSGDDFTILPFIACGGKGVISVVSNIAPGDTARLVKESAAGNWSAARPLNTRIVALTKLLFSTSSPIPIKAAMGLCGWCSPHVRLPLVRADEKLTQAMKSALEAYRGKSGSLDGFMS
jgi:4-hydroxy-tetrahydrodipicolinate synthase